MNYPVIIGVAVLVLILIAYLVKRNEQDKKEYVEELNQEESDAENGKENS